MPDIAQLIISTAQAQGVDPRLALEVAIQESSLDETAIGAAGEVGVYQLMPETAAQLGVDPRDLLQNIQGGISLLSSLLGQFGNPAAALAAYNWGPGRTATAISAYGDQFLDHAPLSTQSYVSRILGNVRTQYKGVFSVSGAVDQAVSKVSDAASNVDSDTWKSLGWILGFGIAAWFAGRMLLSE